MRDRGWKARRPGTFGSSQIPFAFYGREGVLRSPVHAAFFWWCRGEAIYKKKRNKKTGKTVRVQVGNEAYFRNCKERNRPFHGPKHGPFPEVAVAKGIDKWKASMHTTTAVLFPRQKLPWHRTWIWVAHDLEGYFNQVISPFAMEGDLTKGSRYNDMMTKAVIMGAAWHKNLFWERKEMKTDLGNIAYLRNYDPTDFENTLPFRPEGKRLTKKDLKKKNDARIRKRGGVHHRL